MNRLICIVIALALAAPIFGQETAAESKGDTKGRAPEAIEVLEKTAAALKKIKSVRYRAVGKPSGMAVQWFPAVKGAVIQRGWQHGMPKDLFVDVDVVMPGKAETVKVTGGGNGDTYFVIDHANGKAYADMDPAVMGSVGAFIPYFGLTVYVEDDPLADALESEMIELLDAARVGDHECHRVLVKNSPNREEIWHIATQGHLPLRRVQRFDFAGQTGEYDVTLSHLQIDPRVVVGTFALKLPDGYEQIDDFAP